MSIIHPQFNLRCGDAWLFSGPMVDGSGNPLNLASVTLTWKLDSIDGTTNIITLALGSGITITNLTTATVSYGPTKEQTATVPPGTYYDTLRVDFSDGTTGFDLVEGVINAAPAPV